MPDDTYDPGSMPGYVITTHFKGRKKGDYVPNPALAERVAGLGTVWGADASKPILDDLFLINGVLPLRGLVGLYGAPGTGKTFVALHMAYCISRGYDFLGRRSEQAAVIYCALEGGGVFPNRCAAYVKHYGLNEQEQSDFGLVRTPMNLRTKNGHGPALSELIKQSQDQGHSVRLVVIDTLNRAFEGGDENSGADMGAFLSQAEALQSDNDLCVLFVHHSGKDKALGMRGHSSLLGAVDTELKVVREDECRILTVSKQRDGEGGQQFGFDLEIVELGTTPAGDDVTSAVMVRRDLKEIKSAAKPFAIGANQNAVLRSIEILTAEPGCERNPSGPGWPDSGRYSIVLVDDVITHAVGLIAKPEGKRDRRRSSLARAIDKMVENEVIGRNDGHVWLIKTGVEL